MFTATVVVGVSNKSGYTQAHGLLRSGIVTSVTNYEGRGDSSDVVVRLDQPVDGHAVTTAYFRPLTSLKPGAAVRVLVDPNDPGYAEFPGHRFESNSLAQISAAVFLAGIGFFTFTAVRWGRVWFRQRKRLQARGIQGSGVVR